jgi:chemotaxis protein methyltransferase CheR
MIVDDISFNFFADFLQKKSGYHLLPEKKYLLETRIEDVLKKNTIGTVGAVIKEMQSGNSKIISDVIEAMTVNETLFFRDKAPFEVFEKTILPQLLNLNTTGPIRIWSAACSTGQEPYSIAMILEEYGRHHFKGGYEIIGTDINQSVIEKAKKGIFSNIEVDRGLPSHFRDKYFQPSGTGWQISEKIRSSVKFEYLNLHDNFMIPGLFHFILLRNVLIYFDKKAKYEVIRKVACKMYPKGYLLLGSAENIYDTDTSLKSCSDVRGLYSY